MIPKIIHYCWLSNDPIPINMQKCMETWKKFLPDYTLMLWNFDCFPKQESKWVQEAFEHKKYAFAADYIRLFALYNYGGIYLDMDVEVLRSFNDFLSLNTMLCWQNGIPGLEVAAMGVEKGSPWIKKCLDRYVSSSFVLPDGKLNTKVMPLVVEEVLKAENISFVDVSTLSEAKNVISGIPVFPCYYFSPKNYLTKKMDVNDKTVCIHHFDGTWVEKSVRFKTAIYRLIGLNLTAKIKQLKKIIKNS